MAQASGDALNRRSTDSAAVTMVRLLGPVDVVVDGEPAPLRSRNARTLLAALAVNAGQVTSAGTLVHAVWGDDAPRTARHALHVYVSKLRKQAGEKLPILGRHGGYMLQAEVGQLDTDRFEDLVARGKAELATGNAGAAATLLKDALSLWRGPVLGDVPADRFAETFAQRWEELWHTAQESLVDAELAAGRHADVVADIETMVRAQPFRERRWGQLMIALYRSGQQRAALDRYQEVRTLLTEELGIDPSPHLRTLEGAILRQDDVLVVHDDREDANSDPPVTRYATGPAGRIAFQVLGEGPVNLVFIPGFAGNLEIRWEEPTLSQLYRRLAQSARLVLLDRRGTGVSDRENGVPPIEDQVDDVLAVMDAAGVERAVLLGVMDGAAIALLTAAASPERVSAVITFEGFASAEQLGAGAGQTIEVFRSLLERGAFLDEALPMLAPSRVDDAAFARWLGRYSRLAVGAGGAESAFGRIEEVDIRSVLPSVDPPVLALHRRDDPFIPSANAEYIATHVQDGRFVLLPGSDTLLWAGDIDSALSYMERFLREMRETPAQSRRLSESGAESGAGG